jgi:hypothetical protein
MSKLVRPLMLVAMLAAMNLAAMTAVAHARTADQPSGQADATVRRLLAREWSTIPNEAPAHPRLLLDEERSSLLNLPNAAPAQTTSPVRPAPSSGQAGWRILALGVLATILALVAAVAVMAARRIHRSQRAGQTA